MTDRKGIRVIIPERLARLPEIVLDRGRHASFEEGHSATEVIAWITGQEHTRRPARVSPVLVAFLCSANDALGDEDRQKLKPYLPRAIGTAGDGHDELRGWLAIDWLVRVYTPTGSSSRA